MAEKTGDAVQRIAEETRKRIGDFSSLWMSEMRTSPMGEMVIDAIKVVLGELSIVSFLRDVGMGYHTLG